ncbi:GmrSD restriction endonuclease domain-containing protein [Nocardia brasiliensis]|uniref:GmrSD restriction endonuclease domain-containing protein n=1 Tax=Nocardia brasiliensis TaxID=37326 RepID=UPI0018932846|nr:DUF262 domain-containing protein [Nocardia brasiliensis]MBF6541485.1 DUF262 domain-containing protein [Nocardia brasiliensis]
MALDSPRLQEVLENIRTGTMQLPDFQRVWKWDDQRIRELIATVTLDYPLGVVMTLETGEKSPFRARPLTGAESVAAVDPSLLLLDGQQRLTSLFQAMYLDKPVQTVDSRGKELRRWYYIDIVKALGSPADRDDAIISVPEDKLIRRDHFRKASLDLSSTELECAAGYFPLHAVFDTQKVHGWQRKFVEANADNWDLWSQFDEGVIRNIRGFLIPMIRLASSTTSDAVCSVFERVNTGGVPLNVFELLTATYAGDRAYEQQHSTYYRLPEIWHDIKKRLASSYPALGRLENGAEDGLTSSDFLQAVALVRTWELKQQGVAAAVSCKRRDLLELPLADFDRLAPRLRDAFEWTGEFLAQQCIVRVSDVPYRTQLVPLAAVRAILADATDDPIMLSRITRWYWCGVLGEMYGGATESRFPRDVEQLVGWSRSAMAIPDTIAEAAFLADRLDTLTTRNSAAYKGIYALLIKQGAVDWYYSEAPLNSGTLLQHAVDLRQIFPKNRGGRQQGSGPRLNSIVNKTPLSYRASRSLVGSPKSYVPVLASESGVRGEWFDDVIATHLIDPIALRDADFTAFYADRSKQLLQLVDDAMGKRSVHRDAEVRR